MISRLGIGACGLVAGLSVSNLAWGGTAAEIRSTVDAAFARSAQLQISLQDLGDADPGDRQIISNYYSQVNANYVAQPLLAWTGTLSPAVTGYTQKVSSAVESARLDFTAVPSAQLIFNNCTTSANVGRLASAGSEYLTALRTAAQSVAQPLNVSRGYNGGLISARTWTDGSSSFDRAAEVLDKNWAESMSQCCTTAAASATGAAADKLAQLSTSCSKLSNTLNAAQDAFQNSLTKPVFNAPTDPLRDRTNLSTHDLAMLIQTGSMSDAFRRARASGDSGAEALELTKLQLDCERQRAESQRKRHPINKSALANLAKTLKCSVAPSLATIYGTPNLAYLAIGVGSANIQGEGWDLNCDPAEMALYASQNTTDPNVIAKEFGLDVLANPAYIARMRQLAPLTVPYQSVPGGGYVTPWGGLNLSSNIYLKAQASTSSGLVASNGVVSSGSGRRVAASRGNITGLQRGLTDSAALTRGARALSGEIARGSNVLRNATVLSSGARNTHALTSKMVANTSKAPLSSKRRVLASEGQLVSSKVRALASGRASSAQTGGILGSLKGRQTARSTTTTGNVGSITQIQQENEAQRKRNEAKANSLIQGMEYSRAKSEEARQKILQLVGERDLAIQQAIGSMINMTKKKRYDTVTNLRRELLEKDKEIAAVKAEFDVYQSAILESAGAIQTMMALGSKNASYTSLSALSVNTSGLSGLPTATTTTTGSGVNSDGSRGTVIPKSGTSAIEGLLKVPSLFDWLVPVRAAWAANGPSIELAWRTEEEWSQKWNKFVNDYSVYVERRRGEAKDAARDAMALLAKRNAAITAETATDSSTETLLVMDGYSRALAEETQDLVAAADLKDKSMANLPGNALALLRQARDDAQAAQNDLETLALQYKDAYPLAAEDDPEAVWSVVPDLILN